MTVHRQLTTFRATAAVIAVLVLASCSAEGTTLGPAGTGVSSQTISSTGTAAGATSAPGRAAPGTSAPATSTLVQSAAKPATSASSSVVSVTPETTSDASSTAEPPPKSPTSAAANGFVSTVSIIDAATAARMATSWRPGCPVELTGLRYVTLTYRGFDGADHQGELVVAESVVPDVVAIFNELYDAGYPIASLRLVDDFGGSDDNSMAANNSSAFNCRPVTGGGGFSEHSYGTAIDLNPVQNPYLSGSLVLPELGRPFVNRDPAPGVIEPGDAVVTAFAEHGWTWGGTWSGPIDYQHFSVSGR